MKIIKLLFVAFGFLLIIGSCNCDTKADTWSDEQKTEWTKSCKEFMKTNAVEEQNAVDFCDCMLEKTAQDYSPEEAAKITEDEERKLWESCDYTW
jgi:hypothetical protein